MRMLPAVLGAVAAAALGLPAYAQTVPESVDEVARPGGQLPGDPQIARTAFSTRSGSPAPFDGSGRIFVVERVGRVQVVNEDGSRQDEPFLDLTKINRSATTCRPASSSRACIRSRSTRSFRRTATSSCTTRRCRSTATG